MGEEFSAVAAVEGQQSPETPVRTESTRSSWAGLPPQNNQHLASQTSKDATPHRDSTTEPVRLDPGAADKEAHTNRTSNINVEIFFNQKKSRDQNLKGKIPNQSSALQLFSTSPKAIKYPLNMKPDLLIKRSSPTTFNPNKHSQSRIRNRSNSVN